ALRIVRPIESENWNQPHWFSSSIPCSFIFCLSFAILSGSTPGLPPTFFGGILGNPMNSLGVPGGGPSLAGACDFAFVSFGFSETFPNPRTGSCRGTAVGLPALTRDGKNHTANGIAISTITLFHQRFSTASVACSNQRKSV